MSRIKIGEAAPLDLANMLSAISTSTSPKIFADCDVVIEAVTENESLKKEVYKGLAQVIRPDAILATNTSTISITRMAESAPNPEQFIGMRTQPGRSDGEPSRSSAGPEPATSLSRRSWRFPRRSAKRRSWSTTARASWSTACFSYMNENVFYCTKAMRMESIDKAATKFGMPVGPLALTDMVGLQTASLAGKVLAHAYPDRAATSPILDEMLKRAPRAVRARDHEVLGQRGQGVAAAAGGPRDHRQAQDRGTERWLKKRSPIGCFSPCCSGRAFSKKESSTRARRRRHGADPGDRFSIFKGGILRWCDSEGASAVVERLARYASLGKRFQPTEMLTRMAQKGESFYPRPKLAAG